LILGGTTLLAVDKNLIEDVTPVKTFYFQSAFSVTHCDLSQCLRFSFLT